eukprot:819554-Pelagomonas_calceolata.AAC.1
MLVETELAETVLVKTQQAETKLDETKLAETVLAETWFKGCTHTCSDQCRRCSDLSVNGGGDETLAT